MSDGEIEKLQQESNVAQKLIKRIKELEAEVERLKAGQAEDLALHKESIEKICILIARNKNLRIALEECASTHDLQNACDTARQALAEDDKAAE